MRTPGSVDQGMKVMVVVVVVVDDGKSHISVITEQNPARSHEPGAYREVVLHSTVNVYSRRQVREKLVCSRSILEVSYSNNS